MFKLGDKVRIKNDFLVNLFQNKIGTIIRLPLSGEKTGYFRIKFENDDFLFYIHEFERLKKSKLPKWF